MKPNPKVYVGIDSALAFTGLAALLVPAGASTAKLLRTHTIQTEPKSDQSDRLVLIWQGVRRFVLSCMHDGAVPNKGGVGIEGFSFGDKFRKYDLGASAAAARLAVAAASRDIRIEVVSPQKAKAAVCPKWHGSNKDNWIAAGGKPDKFKRSMPTKDAVQADLWSRLGFDVRGEHEADAVAVALHLAIQAGATAPER